MDLTSLYTVITNGEGLLALKHFFDLHTVKEPNLETLLPLSELVLILNCFHSRIIFINGVMVCHGYQNGTQLLESFRKLH